MSELKYGLLIGILANHGIDAKRAWELPAALKMRGQDSYGADFRLSNISEISLDELIWLLEKPTKLHRFNNKISMYINQSAIQINQNFNGDIDKLFIKGDNKRLIRNVQELPGMSEKKAKHLLVYLCALDSNYQLKAEEHTQYTQDCMALIKKFDRNLKLLNEVNINR